MSGLTYEDVGVSFKAKETSMRRIGNLLKTTYDDSVLSELGHFGGLYRLAGYNDPVLVSSTDSVGTKLKVAFMMNRHDTIGYDIVAHCGNDIVVQGAKPLFFLDYIGCNKILPDVTESVVSGLVRGCKEVGCALIGGETAELPEFYGEGEYDLVGFIVGVVERDEIITGSDIKPGDRIIGLPSLGLHTNGFTLARKALLEVAGYRLQDYIPELGCTLGEELLKPHKSYVRTILTLMKEVRIKGIAHITGGGIPDNLIRILPQGCQATIRRGSWMEPPVFDLIRKAGGISDEEMFHVFNMGIGMCVVVDEREIDRSMETLRSLGENPVVIGEIESGERSVQIGR
ncbi:TPA: phosphoribosylformylglycinamidine cyclo-ligase [Candidatus Poribacteria bacterium]|nr:phosphoribosylformylglycinamidine cyclo-ligase [Candidatus Poribacteria bacterium]